jgi:hypothetical protein
VRTTTVSLVAVCRRCASPVLREDVHFAEHLQHVVHAHAVDDVFEDLVVGDAPIELCSVPHLPARLPHAARTPQAMCRAMPFVRKRWGTNDPLGPNATTNSAQIRRV